MSTRDESPRLAEARVATDESYFLAEGPMWDSARSRVVWVDIMEGRVLTGRLHSDGTIRVLERVEVPDIAAAATVADDGRMLIAGAHRLYVRELDGSLTAGPQVVAGTGRRFNDGKPDPRGLFVAGTKSAAEQESLLRFEEDGSVTPVDGDLAMSNGLGWSPDGRLLYSVDTLRGRVHVRDYDPETGAIGPRKTFLTVQDGLPDGLAVDAEGCVWLALWGGARVVRCAPDGEIVGHVELPTPHVSSVAFVGPDLGTLVITTAREGLSDARLRAHSFAGRMFTARPGIHGAPVAPWSGRIDRSRLSQAHPRKETV